MRAGLAVVACFVAVDAAAQDCPPGVAWPEEDWPSRAAEVAAARPAAVAALDAYAFTLTGADAERRGIRTDGVVVVQRGVILYERYGRGFDGSHRHLTWSVSKSVVNALTGIAVQRGRLGVDDSICDHLALANRDACTVRVRHLLEFSSGFDWKETYEGESPSVSSVLAMLYGAGWRDMAAFVSDHPLRDPPGESWMYSSGDSTLLAAVVGEALDGGGADFAWRFLFDPLGITTATFERDGRGQLVGASLWYATPRDMARFGYLYLHDGCWRDQRILPPGWVAESTRPSDAMRKPALAREPGDVQGRQWWLNRTVPGRQETLPWPDVPEGSFAALGHWGQSITVIPSRQLVVVRTADDRDDTFDRNEFLRLVLAVAEEP